MTTTSDDKFMDDALRETVYGWNETSAPYRNDVSIHAYFEELVSEQPDAIALECSDEILSYRQLNERVNRLANTIRSSVGSSIDEAIGKRNGEAFVALYLNRDTNMIVSILAVLKAGAACKFFSYKQLHLSAQNDSIE